MTLSEELIWRGFISQFTYRELKELDETKVTFYHGYDASADSQTVGNLAAMMFDKALMRHGTRPSYLRAGLLHCLVIQVAKTSSDRSRQKRLSHTMLNALSNSS